jgi:hypothetical protein
LGNGRVTALARDKGLTSLAQSDEVAGGGLASDDLRDALVAHLQHAGNFSHREFAAIGGADRLIAVRTQLGGAVFKLSLALGVLLGECRQAGFGLRCLAFAASDPGIVGTISASRFA